MELRSTREMRRNEQLSKVLAKKADTSDAPAKAQAPKRQTPDMCTLSRQALAYLDQQNRLQQQLEERRAKYQSKLAEDQNKSSELDLLKKAMDVMHKCLKIAASIMKGNKVPPEDLEYLMKNDPDGYRLALAMRRENPDPKEEKSVLDDEDRNGGSVEESGGESPAVSAPEASSGSGEASAPAE